MIIKDLDKLGIQEIANILTLKKCYKDFIQVYNLLKQFFYKELKKYNFIMIIYVRFYLFIRTNIAKNKDYKNVRIPY